MNLSRRPPQPLCFFRAHGLYERGEMPRCSGRLVRCHLLPQQLLKSTRAYKALESNEVAAHWFLYDPRAWVWGCGGPVGCGGHHGMFDTARTIRLQRSSIPADTEELAAELDLEWFLAKAYGERARCTAR
jgi:hypothetical protein